MPGIKRKSAKAAPLETKSRSKKLKVDKVPSKKSTKSDESSDIESDGNDTSSASGEDVEMEEPQDNKHEKRVEKGSKSKGPGHSADSQTPSTLSNLNCKRTVHYGRRISK
jgi:hypothetical protein